MMQRLISALIILGMLPVVTAEVNVPPGYYFEELMPRESGFSQSASINNCGDIVWSTRLGGADWATSEIFLYRDGVVEQLTDDNIRDDFPSINDDGTIVWSRADGPNGVLEIVQYRDGVMTRITDESQSETPRQNAGPVINSHGQISWDRTFDVVCTPSNAQILFFDGERIEPISEIGLSNKQADMNDLGDIVWTEYNFCNSPWTSRILLYSEGAVQEISDDGEFAQRVSINNNRFVTWSAYDATLDRDVIEGWYDGQRMRVVDDGYGGWLNNHDALLYIRNSDVLPWRVMLYAGGKSTVIAANDVIWNINEDINDVSEIVWHFGNFPQTAVHAILRHRRADLNCDRTVTVADIHPFILALINSDSYQQQFPSCDPLLADFNNDGFVTVSDIGGFVSALTLL